MAVDVTPLWDFSKPDVSEQRFRAALESASGDDALILQTQVARTYGLRGQFDTAREVLKRIESDVQRAGPEARVRYDLELGRTYASATHPPQSQTPQTKEQARQAYERALVRARTAGWMDWRSTRSTCSPLSTSHRPISSGAAGAGRRTYSASQRRSDGSIDPE
jgi:hypothetical protein